MPTPITNVLGATLPTPSLTVSEKTLWVCVDRAIGYESASEQSRIVWRISKQEGWQFTGIAVPNAWVHVTLEDGRSAFMKRTDLCDNPLPAASVSAPVSSCPTGCLVSSPVCLIKGNISSDTKEKIYHIPGQKFYTSTVIDPEQGERWFCTENEAIANGWRKSRE
jgi:hypothetical protein